MILIYWLSAHEPSVVMSGSSQRRSERETWKAIASHPLPMRRNFSTSLASGTTVAAGTGSEQTKHRRPLTAFKQERCTHYRFAHEHVAIRSHIRTIHGRLRSYELSGVTVREEHMAHRVVSRKHCVDQALLGRLAHSEDPVRPGHSKTIHCAGVRSYTSE